MTSTLRADTQAVKTRVRDLVLLALTFSSGAADAISFLALGGVFSAFMTGNVAFLGLRVAGARSPDAWAILTAMAAFAVGVYLSARIVKRSEGSCVWPKHVTVALGFSLIPHLLFVAVWSATGGEPPLDAIRVLLGFWGLAMGMQSAAIRRLHVEGVFTTAATATVIVLASDLTAWSETAAERRRLGGILLCLLAGATAGGLLLVHAHRYAPFLTIVVSAAATATAWIFLRDREAPETGATTRTA
jgi:uncharacterized membrane protein YoaK (UPF0700 family)